MTKPSLFVGSSSEGLEIARAIEYQLQQDTEITIWNEGFFGLGNTTLETLVNSLDRFDFAALILSPDDFVISREISSRSPRDNVMFELGLFMGRLGRARTFIIYDISSDLKIPSDLAGVTAATFVGNRTDKNMIAAVGPACTLIRNAVKDLGNFEGKSFRQLQTATGKVEAMSETVSRLIYLMARSRAVELEITSQQFGGLIAPEFLKKIQEDLNELEQTVKDTEAHK